jgi:hypothetical protein
MNYLFTMKQYKFEFNRPGQIENENVALFAPPQIENNEFLRRGGAIYGNCHRVLNSISPFFA